MIDRIDEHPTPTILEYFEKRGGKDRRKMHTMIDPNKDRRKGDRRKRNATKNRNDRRSGKDRREASSKKYFLEGGLERRSWKERRNYWYMTR